MNWKRNFSDRTFLNTWSGMDCCKLSNLLSHRHNTHVTQTCFSCNIRHITHATQACSSCHIDMQRWLYLCHILGVEFIFPLFILCRTFLKKIVVCQIYLGRNILRIKWYWGPYPAPHSFYIWTWWIRMGFKDSYHSKRFKSSYFYDGGKKNLYLCWQTWKKAANT